jgi:DNA-binding PadR family transcriptional regulator
MSGYDLTREFDLTLGHVWSARHSQIYPELSRLASEGLIEHIDSGPRGRKRYGATETGRAEVLRWLREDDPGRELRVEAWLQGFFYWMLEPEEAVALLTRERLFHEAKLATYESLATSGIDWVANPQHHAQRIMLEAGIRYERGLVEWSDWAIGEIRRGEATRGVRS